LIAIALIDKIERRKLMFLGSMGQFLSMIFLALLEDNSAAGIASAVPNCDDTKVID